MRKYFILFLLVSFFVFTSCREGIVEFPGTDETGTVFINSLPDGADIYINQSWTGRSTPDSVTDLQPGIYQLKLKLVGYRDTTIAVSIVKGRKLSFSITLRDY